LGTQLTIRPVISKLFVGLSAFQDVLVILAPLRYEAQENHSMMPTLVSHWRFEADIDKIVSENPSSAPTHFGLFHFTAIFRATAAIPLKIYSLRRLANKSMQRTAMPALGFCVRLSHGGL